MNAEYLRYVQPFVVGTSVGLVSLLMYVSFIGWGGVVTTFFAPRSRIGVGLRGALGMSFTAVVGGAFNLLGIISPFSLVCYLVSGAALSLFFFFPARTRLKSECQRLFRIYRRSRLLVLLSLFAMALLMVQFAAVGSQQLSECDDYHGYLVFPVKMLQTGTSSPEPFNTRGMCNLGGQSFLLALTLTLVPLTRVHLLEMGAAWLVVLGLLIEHAREVGARELKIAGLVILLCLLKFPEVNLTSVVTGFALYYATIRILGMDDEQIADSSRLVMLGLVAAAICSLKASHIPCLVAIVTTFYLFAPGMGFAKRVSHVMAIAVIVLVALGPWMVTSYLNYGTFMYPLLGKGNASSFFADFVRPSGFRGFFQVLMRSLASTVVSTLFIGGLVLAVFLKKDLLSSCRGRAGVLSFVGAWTGAVAVSVMIVAEPRFLFPATLAATLFLLVECLNADRETGCLPLARADKALIGTTVLVFVLGAHWTGGLIHAKQRLVREVVGRGDWSSTERRLHAMQASIPEAAPMLVHVSTPFLLNFPRNPLYVIDQPGGVSPPPGLPMFGKPEQIAEYLRSRPIRFVAYSYADEAGFSDREKIWQSAVQYPTWRISVELIFAFHRQLDEIADMYERVFDDGHTYVIDLWKKRVDIRQE